MSAPISMSPTSVINIHVTNIDTWLITRNMDINKIVHFVCDRYFYALRNHWYSTLSESTHFSRSPRSHTFSTLWLEYCTALVPYHWFQIFWGVLNAHKQSVLFYGHPRIRLKSSYVPPNIVFRKWILKMSKLNLKWNQILYWTYSKMPKRVNLNFILNLAYFE